jgi:hypothetical protein
MVGHGETGAREERLDIAGLDTESPLLSGS